ncbi:MAG TPA: adenylate/guanylate cyclase domain-containing protein [Holophagaceae bacterium]|nr:adenylate/guanylate cyclase domain-containing protein [Holophagaceae bacterium]
MTPEPEDSVSFWQYFRSPFPKAEGFSAYRSPGLVVHGPVILVFLWLGCWLSLGDPWLYPLFAIFVVMGLYLGRDLAILAHYNCLITLLALGGGVAVLRFASLPPHLSLLLSAAVTGALVVLFALYVSWTTDTSRDRAPGPGASRFPFLQRFIDRIDQAATLEEDSEPLRLRKTLLIFLCAASLLVAPWGARHLSMLGLPIASRVALGFALVSLTALLLLLATKRVAFAAWLQLLGLLVAPFLIQWEMGGFAASGALVFWSLLAPLCALVFLGPRWALPWFAAFALAVLAAAGLDRSPGADVQSVVLYAENILLVSTLAFIALRFFIIERDRAEALLARERDRSERLLLNILPASIAARLKDEHMAFADGYTEVSILFADIVGFTKLSATMDPRRLVEVLNRLFSRFDTLCDQFGAEKIKTIGDAYMVCAGLPTPRADHAEALAGLALAMQTALEEHNREFGSDLSLRIGINSGPVVAGIIGLKKFIYDLWGDTVNLASRMESNGIPGRIQVSAATRERLKDLYAFEARGALDIKGLGATEAFLLVEPARASRETP